MARWRLLAVLLTMALGAAAGLAVAQDIEAGEEDGGEGEVEVRRRADLTPEEQLDEGQRIQDRGAQLSRRVQNMLDESRRDQDIIRVTCLNDKLTQVNANLRTTTERVGALQNAADAQDSDRRNHEYTVLTVLSQKFDVLEQESNQCVGQDPFDTGATAIVTSVDPGGPTEDPGVTAEPPSAPVPFIPPPASPAI